MSGVKGENSLKLFGDDLDELTRLAGQIEGVMTQVRGVTDAGVFKVNGQPSMVIKREPRTSCAIRRCSR